jgi:hypothetical protein
MNPGPRLFIALGLMLLGTGIMWHFGARWIKLGRLPGDVVLERPGMRVYFPIVTSLLISAALSAIGLLIQYVSGRSGR